LHPFPAVVAGAITGLVTSAMLLLVMSTVYDEDALFKMAWIGDKNARTWSGFWQVLLSDTRSAWPYLIMGTFLGSGMALMTNGLRASKRWPRFLDERSSLTGVRQTWRLIGALAKLALRFAWPIPLALLIAGLLAFAVLRSAPASRPWNHPWTQSLSAGLTRDPGKLREWKASPWGQAFGIIGDSATQAIGGFFAIVGMGLGIVIIRYGVKVEPRRN
jgi:hypothetical protein